MDALDERYRIENFTIIYSENKCSVILYVLPKTKISHRKDFCESQDKDMYLSFLKKRLLYVQRGCRPR